MELSFKIDVANSLSGINKTALNLEFKSVSFPAAAVFR